MEKKKFTRINNIVAIVILLISSFVYLSTIEPTTSFWDCGEFIASSYKLEVGHPPGNPVFNLFARFFTMFTDSTHAAMAVNAMSALCSAFTIFFLYLSIAHFARRIYEKRNQTISLGNAIAIFGAGAVGALAYCFSDTFWFSAVEGEVYAMSSLFTAIVFWAILKWEEDDSKYADRWIVLIALLMGLSIGVHLLNLLAIPPIVFTYYYKKSSKITWKGIIGVFLLSIVILAFILFFIIPYIPKIAALFDRMFVNGFGAKFNIGATVFMVVLLAACFFVLYLLRKQDKAVWHTIVLCFTTILIGYSTFSMVIIRSSANTPTNEYQPDNPYTLVRYLGREQYGSAPLIYGQAYTSPYDVQSQPYYTPLNDAYYRAENITPRYPSGAKMFFPRMWNSFDSRYSAFYDSYTGGKFRTKTYMDGGELKKTKMPYFKDNLAFFFDFQVNYMYIRYFMWNFVGRQNDFHGDTPGNLTKGNWESGIKFIDNVRLGDQSDGPDILVHNRGKNHYFFLPLILGLIGFFFQLKHDSRNNWITALLFLLTGLAIVLYLNQPPYQVRERDYAYAGSFYVFCIWIGLAVVAIQSWLEKGKGSVVVSSLVTLACLCVPILMGCENWDDHDRSGRYTARDLAYNYLMGTDPNAIVITHGDNDTFPLWYIQEVEHVRNDIRIVNTSLLGTDWYIDQMKNKQYDSDPLPITLERKQYLYGTNDYPYVLNAIKRPVLASEAIDVFRNPKYVLNDGKTDFIPAKTLLIPVNKENVKKYHIVAEKDYDKIVDTVTLTISGDRFGKTDLIILDILAHYDWDRPIYSVVPGADVDLGLQSWMQYEGLLYKFIPIRTEDYRKNPHIDTDKMYNNLMNVYRFDSLKDSTIHVDYQNIYTFCAVSPIRDIFATTAEALVNEGQNAKAIDLLDKCMDILPEKSFPYNLTPMHSLNEFSILNVIELYLTLGEKDKAKALANAFADETTAMARHYATPVGKDMISQEDAASNISYIYYLVKMMKDHGEKEFAQLLESKIGKFYMDTEEKAK
ncbi:MAG: DUF2723 domain-containing protein [Bacteroidales bacterium]|nr:DUF2723 domain-containing protein [Bacteroidales bacterium]